MWANAQRRGRPAEHRWRPLFNAAKFGWRPLLDCRAVTLPKRDIRWNMTGCPKPANRSQPLLGRSWPYCKDIWRRYCCLPVFFDCRYMPYLRRYSPTKSCNGAQMAIFCTIFASCISSEPLAAHFRPAVHSKFALRPHHVSKYGRHPICGRWVGEERKNNIEESKKPQGKNIMVCPVQ